MSYCEETLGRSPTVRAHDAWWVCSESWMPNLDHKKTVRQMFSFQKGAVGNEIIYIQEKNKTHTSLSVINSNDSLPCPATGQWTPGHCGNFVIAVTVVTIVTIHSLFILQSKGLRRFIFLNQWWKQEQLELSKTYWDKHTKHHLKCFTEPVSLHLQDQNASKYLWNINN